MDIIDRALYYLNARGAATLPTPCLITHYVVNDPGHAEPSAPYVPLGQHRIAGGPAAGPHCQLRRRRQRPARCREDPRAVHPTRSRTKPSAPARRRAAARRGLAQQGRRRRWWRWCAAASADVAGRRDGVLRRRAARSRIPRRRCRSRVERLDTARTPDGRGRERRVRLSDAVRVVRHVPRRGHRRRSRSSCRAGASTPSGAAAACRSATSRSRCGSAIRRRRSSALVSARRQPRAQPGVPVPLRPLHFGHAVRRPRRPGRRRRLARRVADPQARQPAPARAAAAAAAPRSSRSPSSSSRFRPSA